MGANHRTVGNFLGDDKFEEHEQYAPVSPRAATSDGLLQRMNTIVPGPFDLNGRRPSGSQRSVSNGATDSNPDGRTMFGHKTQASIGSFNGDGGLRKPKVERTNGYGGFGPPPSRNEGPLEPLGDIRNRANEIQRPQEQLQNPYWRPSNTESSAISPIHQRQPSISGPDLSRPLPPRGASFIGSRDETRLTDKPPVPGVDLASEFGVSNPYHTASESQSSTASGVSEKSNTLMVVLLHFFRFWRFGHSR